MILTDEEIHEFAYGSKEHIGFARAIESAILAKLASADLPEPAPYVPVYRPLYTADQLTVWGSTRFAQGAAAQLAEKPRGYLSQYNLEMLQQGYPQTIVMLEGAKRDVPLYTRRQA